MTIWRMRIECWIPKATDTHSEHVTLIAFTLQQWLHERASVLRCTWIGCLAESTRSDSPQVGNLSLNFRRRIKSRLPFAGIIRRLPYSTRFQDKG